MGQKKKLYNHEIYLFIIINASWERQLQKHSENFEETEQDSFWISIILSSEISQISYSPFWKEVSDRSISEIWWIIFSIRE